MKAVLFYFLTTSVSISG